VVVQGRAEFLEDGPARRALVERFLAKYHPQLEEYWGGRVMPPNRVMFRIVPVEGAGLGADLGRYHLRTLYHS
jgi:nitroimidazol reductase NimA-like FMN-containing flavoprotein (pyridoxamine 5'-phosphate oxidase superfamily)